MKQVGKVLLYFLLVLGYIGVICWGVMLVIEEEPVASPVQYSGQRIASAWGQLYHTKKRLVSDVFLWAEKEAEQRLAFEYYAQEVMANMTTQQKLAQLIILTNEHDIHQANLSVYQPGGIIFFQSDFAGKTMEQVAQRVEGLQSYMEIPLLVGVDEEGGSVSRLKTMAEPDVPTFEGARVLAQKGKDAVINDTQIKMEYLKAMGINVNFAPVADVVDDSASYMYSRSASGDPAEVSDYVASIVDVMQREQVVACIKHFPGYSNNVNTHEQLAKDSRQLEEYQHKDFIPFQTGIAKGVDMLMVSHIIMECVDDTNPASLSRKVHELIRGLNYDGIVIADDLNMQAILKLMTIQEATVAAFAAGNDMVFSSDFSASMQGAMQALEEGKVTQQQVDDSVKKVLRLKWDYQLIEKNQE